MRRESRAGAWRFRLMAVCVLAMLSPVREARPEVTPVRGTLDGRIRVASYDREQVYRLRGIVGYQIDLEFEPGETFLGLGAGDIDGISFVGQGNHLFLKPKAARVATNLTVLTNRRHYHFDYTALAEHAGSGDTNVMFAVRFTYPPVLAQSAEAAAVRRMEDELLSASAQRRQNRDYWYCGDPSLRPVLASDDGVHTRLRFAANADLPAIFVRSDDGTESLLNYSMDAGDLIIHRVARRFVVRRGNVAGCIVNKAFSGGGDRLDSGTVAPDVERRVQGGAP
jgi:type IV secretion system protein VirB9